MVRASCNEVTTGTAISIYSSRRVKNYPNDTEAIPKLLVRMASPRKQQSEVEAVADRSNDLARIIVVRTAEGTVQTQQIAAVGQIQRG